MYLGMLRSQILNSRLLVRMKSEPRGQLENSGVQRLQDLITLSNHLRVIPGPVPNQKVLRLEHNLPWALDGLFQHWPLIHFFFCFYRPVKISFSLSPSPPRSTPLTDTFFLKMSVPAWNEQDDPDRHCVYLSRPIISDLSDLVHLGMIM